MSVPAAQVTQGSPSKSVTEGSKEGIRKPAIKKPSVELSEDSSNSEATSASLDPDAAKTVEKEGKGPSHETLAWEIGQPRLNTTQNKVTYYLSM